MRPRPWTVVCLAGAIAASLPLAASHELHLPYLPSLGSDDQVGSYLSLKWSIINGSLYANADRVFPPSMSMQLHASRREGPSKLLVEQNEVEVSYALEARPLSTEENGSASRIVRVRVDLFSPEGNPVTPNAVVLDLLTNPDGSHHITRVRVEPAKSHRENHDHGDRPWRMKFWQTQMGALFKHPQDKQASSSNGESQHNTNPSEAQAVPDSEPDSAAVSQPGFVFSPYWSPTYSRPSHRHARNRDPSRTFMRLVRPVILPALLGAAAGLVACLVGFVVGHLVMSISVRLGLAKKCKQHRRSRVISVEDGSPDEKAQLVPET